MKATILQNKSQNKLLNRAFVISFALIIITWMYYLMTAWDIGSTEPRELLIVPEICFLIIAIGLLLEAWKPSLDLTFHRDRIRIFMSVILFAVFVLNSVYWWLAHGIPNWLPQYGWPKTIIEYLTSSLAMETSSLSLMFGILFLTRSTPKKSLSYKIILIGTVLLELSFFMAYAKWAAIGAPGSQFYADFWGYTVFQPWFWLDLTAEIVIFIGALWLLTRRKWLKT